MKKLRGASECFHWSASMAGLRLSADQLLLIRDDEMDDDWYGLAADACYAKAREAIAATLKTQLVALSHQTPVLKKAVDRRPSRLALTKDDENG